MDWSKVNDKAEFKKKAKELGIPIDGEEDIEEISPLEDSLTDDPDLKKIVVAVNGKIAEINKAVKNNLTKVKSDVKIESEKRESASEQKKIEKFIKDHKILQVASPYSEAILNSMAVFYQKGMPLEDCLSKALKIEDIPKEKLIEFEEAKEEKKEEKPAKKEESKPTPKPKSLKSDEEEDLDDDEIKAPIDIAEASKRAFEALEAKHGNPFKEEENE